MYYQAKCKIDSYVKNGTLLKLFIPGTEVNPKYFVGGIANAMLRVDDSRCISAAQRGLIYSLFSDIACWRGESHKRIGVETVKQEMKAKFCLEANYEIFSLSDVSMTIASEFIDYVLDYTFVENIELTLKPFEISKTVRNYLYLCFKRRKCAVCNKSNAEVHHLDAVGRRNRNKVDHSKMELIMLCRNHHQEAHTIGDETFCNKYHVAGIFVDVATLKALNIRGEYGEEANV